MHKFVSLNSKIIIFENAVVPAVSSSVLYGKGIFTTVPIYDGMPFLWDKHWRRLMANAEVVGVDANEFPKTTVTGALSELLEKNSVTNGRARITLFDESASEIWPFETTQKTSLLITTGDPRPVRVSYRLTVSPFRLNSRSPLAGVKSCNYLEKLMALDEAKSRGFDEAIQVNERGWVASATMVNVFWLTGGLLHTPSLKTGCLPGTTREFILENLECREVETGVEVLKAADAIFLTSAGLGIVSVAEFDSRRLTPDEHPILNLWPASSD